VAVTFLLPFMVSVQVKLLPAKAQSPPQVENVLPPPEASAVRVTLEPEVKLPEHVPAVCEQLLIPPGVLLTRVAALPATTVTEMV